MTPQTEWSQVEIRRLIHQVRRPVIVNPSSTYREIGVRSHGRGLFHKEPLPGVELGEKDIFGIHPGDLVFNIVFAWEGAVGLASDTEAGMVASHRFPTYRGNIGQGDTNYLKWFFQTEEGTSLLELHSPGAAGRNKTLDQWALLRSKIVVPPIGLQTSIARYLDNKIPAIDRLVAAKVRLIELLQEKRQALITQAVTKGLDPKVEMKESGVLWLGKIPSHWVVQELRNRIGRIEQGWSPSCENREAEANEWGVLKVGCVNYGCFTASENKALPRDLNPLPSLEVRAGDVLVSRANTRDLVGSAAFVENTRPRLLLCDKLFRIPYRSEDTEPRFLVLLLQSSVCRYQFEREATGSSGSMQNIGQDSVRHLVFGWAPLEEQRQIVAVVGKRTAQMDEVMRKLERQIDLLREYRQSLISAAVTGQLAIPDEPSP